MALATPAGIGALAIVRLSGPRAWQILSILAADPDRFDSTEPRNAVLLNLVDPSTGSALDQSVVVKYRAPASFTGEDVVEITCHGGLSVPLGLTGAAIAAGARPATAGEFTHRAFLNGKMDLTQAEAVDDLVHARGDLGRELALKSLGGALGHEVESLRALLLDLKAILEYDIDFPDEEHIENLPALVERRVGEAARSIRSLADSFERNILFSRGVLTVIAGEPNVGKSTLFNRLVGEERSIVTGRAGTTRDAVEMEAMIGGLLFRLVDTAGLRHSAGGVEKIGVEYSRRYLKRADLVIFVHEATRAVDSQEKAFISGISGKRRLQVANKIDLVPGGSSALPGGFIPVSATEGTGLEELKQKMAEAALPPCSGENTPQEGLSGAQVTSLRQKNLLESALRALGRIVSLDKTSSEYIVSDLLEATDSLSEITGKITDEDVLERIFERFCVGK
ncbi:MAG: tRNA uridine-5-carboxymethylaminomethyl(34) synthesis GTPase MnmE [Gemmatimonadota bacterium]|nr:tRNA uridine-5-carboxymethylaminomethyl(34) synthesis GTPase MnmE [Gemmatimonadota bacterium]